LVDRAAGNVAGIVDEDVDVGGIFCQLCEIFRLAQVDGVCGGVDLVRLAQPLGQRLELVAAARRQHQMRAFLGKRFGGGRADALRCAGDQDALAAQMKVHGCCLLVGRGSPRARAELLGRRPQSGQHCTAALRRGTVWSIAIRSNVPACRHVHEDVSMSKKQYRIAVIPGDGIGKGVVPEGLRVLEAAAKKHGVAVHFDHFDFASWDYYEKHGDMMPEDWKAKIGKHDAIYFGAVGWPAKIPDHISLWGSLIKFRREFDQYVNLRPVRLMPGVPSPLANRKPGGIDFWVVGENTEGEYSSVGGRMFPDTQREFVVQESVMPRNGVDRILKFAFELAGSRPKKHLTSATKSNGISITMPYWDERVEAMAKNYPKVKWDKYHIDILTALFVLHPDRFDVVVGSNLFGDILSDLGPACTGTIGIAPGGNINPERKYPSVFEPVHGSAPDIAGQGIANPIGQIWSAAMMLDHLGEGDAAAAIVKAIEQVLGDPRTRTRDLGGNADTTACGKAVADMVD